MLLKEPVLEDNEKDARLTPEGQYMMVRQVAQIENWLKKLFIIEKSTYIRQQKEYDRQMIWFLRKKDQSFSIKATSKLVQDIITY